MERDCSCNGHAFCLGEKYMRYLGSKYRLMPFIEYVIEKVTNGKYETFADIFAGTGIVGRTYRERGYNVISNDIQYYSYILNKHYIENNNGAEESLLLHLNAIRGKKGFIYKNYGKSSGKICFSDYNAMKIDSIRLEIEKLYRERKINQSEYIHCLASLLNSIDKYSNTTAIYSSYLKTLTPTAQRKFILKPLSVIEGIRGKMYNEDANSLIRKITGDVLYLDPPYNARQYCRIYHLLETVAKYDNPKLVGENRVRCYLDNKSSYSSTKTAGSSLEDLIFHANFKYIFLSYNNEAIIPENKIKTIMSRYGNYQCYSTKYQRFKLNKGFFQPKYTIEYLHCLKK